MTYVCLTVAALVCSTTRSDEFPTPDDNEPLAMATPLLSPEAAAAAIRLPEGFEASVFAAEPDVRNPIDMAWDHLGRMWVAENYTYADRKQKFRDDLRDRVIVFEDDDQDGTPEKRSVFIDTVTKLTSVEVGRGGVWLMCPPRLLFVPDADHDAIPDGPPQTVLDGFKVADQNYHNFANGLRFGPDGWLYGRCGGSCPGRIGRPGTPDENRVALEGGIWRYNVDLKRVEVVCHGTTNPWGHDFNELGELFFINTVNGHLWHGIHGAHFKRPFTLDPNLDTYELIDQHADHYHYDTTGTWIDSRGGAANDFGGGHAHSGMMIYQDSLWPKEYHGQLMTLNFHGRRANVENLNPKGTGYVGTHGKDFFVSEDPWFRGMEISAGPDGNVYVLDWSDLGECHEHTGVHRNSGRIYKIRYQARRLFLGRNKRYRSILRESNSKNYVELLQTQNSDFRWLAHQGRMRLIELCNTEGVEDWMLTSVADQGPSMLTRTGNDAKLQRRLWTAALVDPKFDARDWLSHPSPVIRTWAVRMMTDHWPIDDCYGPTADSRAAWPKIRAQANKLLDDLIKLKLNDAPGLRLQVASTLQRLPGDLRTTAAAELLALTDDIDVDDHNQSKMIWYGIMSRAEEHPKELLPVIAVSKLPELNELIARSLGERIHDIPEMFNRLFLSRKDKVWYQAVLVGLNKGTVGVDSVEKPESWDDFRQRAIESDSSLAPLCEPLDKIFGDGIPIKELAAKVSDPKSEIQERLSALIGWVRAWKKQDDNIEMSAEIVKAADPLVDDARVNLAAARAITQIPNADVAEQLIRHYRDFRAPVRPQIISMLCLRVEYAKVLMKAIEQGTLRKSVLSASDVRNMHALGNDALVQRVDTTWGKLRETSGERLEEIKRLHSVLTPEKLATANASEGRGHFGRSCASCHMMFGSGERVGPDLTGAQRSSLDYWLHNIVDPDAVVGADYRAKNILTHDGRLLVGLVTQRTRRTMTLASANRIQTIPLDEIENEFETEQSPMPSGLFKPLSDDQIANLISYLMSPTQVRDEPN